MKPHHWNVFRMGRGQVSSTLGVCAGGRGGVGFPGGAVVKNRPANAKDAGDAGSIPGSGRAPMATHSSILAWEISWTEEHGGLSVHGVAKSQTQLSAHPCTILTERTLPGGLAFSK